MFIGLNRFLTTDQVKEKYQIPDDLFAKVLPDLPVAHRQGEVKYHLESEVDQFLADLVRSFRKAPKGNPGRENETSHIAEFVNELKNAGKTWKEILKACKEQWPDDPHVDKVEQIRGTWRRHYPKKVD